MMVSQPPGDNEVPTNGAAPTGQARARGAYKLGTTHGNNIGLSGFGVHREKFCHDRIVHIIAGLIVIVLVMLSFLGLR